MIAPPRKGRCRRPWRLLCTRLNYLCALMDIRFAIRNTYLFCTRPFIIIYNYGEQQKVRRKNEVYVTKKKKNPVLIKILYTPFVCVCALSLIDSFVEI